MGEFRIGRRYAQHSYPDTPRGTGTSAFARNYARGPNAPAVVHTAGTEVEWDYIESGATTPSVDAPITPKVTGRLLYSGVIVVQNNAVGPITVDVQIQVDTGSGPVTLLIPFPQETVDAGGQASIAFEILDETIRTVGSQIQILVQVTASAEGTGTGDSVVLTTDSSTLEIQEVPLATG